MSSEQERCSSCSHGILTESSWGVRWQTDETLAHRRRQKEMHFTCTKEMAVETEKAIGPSYTLKGPDEDLKDGVWGENE